jgi:hypothetical protein
MFAGSELWRIAVTADTKPLFDDLADATLERVNQTYTHTHENGRGAQYGDTMRECRFLTQTAVERELVQLDYDETCTPQTWGLAVFLAGMVDMKLERMRGGYKDDNLVDLIAYAAALAELMKRLTEGNK